MIIVFPMAGESSRFKIEGYQLPKYMLPLRDGEVVFDRVMRPFSKYADHVEFVFAFRDVHNTKEFLVSRLNKLRINKYRLVKLENKTSGQAETVYFALNSLEQKYHKENLSVFNIDTFHNNLKLVNFDGEYRNCDGILEVFEDDGENWSFAKIIDGKVVSTAEKYRISNYASNGLYYFRSIDHYIDTFEEYYYLGSNKVLGETYIAPMYNKIVEKGGLVKAKLIDKADVTFCGVPRDYRQLMR